MQVTKKYQGGGFFGNSQAKFGHMAGAEGGFDRKEFRDLRRRKRRGESLSGEEGQRLNYMKNVRGDRLKKGLAGAALAGVGAAAAGPAIAAKLAAKGGIKGLSGLAGKGGLKGLLGKFSKARKVQQALGDAGFFKGMGETPGSDAYGAPGMSIDDMQLGAIEEFDAAPDDNFDYDAEATGPNLEENLNLFGNYYTGAKGMKVLKGGQKRLDKNNDGKITAEDFKLLRAMLGARLPR